MCRIVRTVVVLALVLVTTGAAASPATAPTVQIENGKIVIPLQRAGLLLLLDVRINGQDAGLFLLDTGANHAFIDKALAEKLGLPKVAATSARAVGGKAPMEVFAVDSIAAGGATRRRTFVAAFDLGPMQKELGTDRLSGVLGVSFFANDWPFTIDWREPALTVFERAQFSPPTESKAFEIRMLDGCPAVKIAVEDELTGWFTADTGTNGEMMLQESATRLAKDFLDRRRHSTSTVIGAGGVLKRWEARLAEIELLGARVKDVPASYGTEGDATATRQSAGAIGWKVLKDFVLTFDLRERKVWATHRSGSVPAEWGRVDFKVKAADVVGQTPLMRAARWGRVEDVKRFIAAGADVRAVDANGYTALHDAVTGGSLEIVEALIAAGARADAKTKEDATPLHMAGQGGSRQIVEPLIKAGAAVNATDVFGRTPLILACENGKAQVAKALLSADADPNLVSASAATALHAAAFAGHSEIVRVLLKNGARPDISSGKRNDDAPPLLVAVMGGSVEIVQLLVEHGADVNATNSNGQTALMGAAGDGNIEIARLLLARGADRRKRDKKGRTALEYAAGRGKLDVASMLYHAAEDAAR